MSGDLFTSDPDEVARTVVFATGSGHVRAVVPADATVWRTKLEELLGEDVWLCSEEELARDYPQFEAGAVPPFGGPEDVVIVDSAIAERDSVVIEGAQHDLSLRLPGKALVDLTRAWVSAIQLPD